MNNIKNSAMIKLVSLVIAAVFSLSAYAISEKSETAIKERTAPMAQVCLEGDDSCGAPVVAASSGPKSAEDVYNGGVMLVTLQAQQALLNLVMPRLGALVSLKAWTPYTAMPLAALTACLPRAYA